VEQSLKDFFAERDRNRCRSHVFPIFDIPIRSVDIRNRRLKLFKVDQNLHVFDPHFFFGGGEAPEYFDRDYKTEHTIDHLSKFQGDRPRELGDFALKKRNRS